MKDKNVVLIENVHAYLDKQGTVWLNAEDAARGLGFVEVKKDRVATSGDNYEAIRWARINEYLQSFGFSQKVGKDDFIPENMFYRLAMKASNETAQIFQAKVADEILPAIRKQGYYSLTERSVEEIERELEAFKRQETTVLTAKEEVIEAQKIADKALRALDIAKQNFLLESEAYKTIAKSAHIKPNESLLSEPETRITLAFLLEKIKQEYTVPQDISTRYLYNLLKEQYKISNAFNTDRATISSNEIEQIIRNVTDTINQQSEQQNLLLAQQNKTLDSIIETLAVTTRTVQEVVDFLSKEGIMLEDDKQLNSTNLISLFKTNSYPCRIAPKRKGCHCGDSVVFPNTIRSLKKHLVIPE